MNTYNLQITTPAGVIFEDDAYQLSVRAVDGELAILAGHIPFCTAVVCGACRVYDGNREVRHAEIGNGILSVLEEKTVLLTSSFKWTEPQK